MPKIKVYKGSERGVMIPVSEAKTANAFQCPWTKKVFATKASYVKHLKQLRTDRIHRAIRRKIREKIFNDLINQVSFEKIIEWIETHPEFIFDTAFPNGVPSHYSYNVMNEDRSKFWIKITHLSLNYGDSVSNSHSCPRGGTTNWGGREVYKDGTPKPRGYPGWAGRIEYQLSHDLGFGSRFMEKLGIHTGTGGGTDNLRYGFDVKFFESDWPGLRQLRVLAEIKDDRKMLSVNHGEPNYFKSFR